MKLKILLLVSFLLVSMPIIKCGEDTSPSTKKHTGKIKLKPEGSESIENDKNEEAGKGNSSNQNSHKNESQAAPEATEGSNTAENDQQEVDSASKIDEIEKSGPKLEKSHIHKTGTNPDTNVNQTSSGSHGPVEDLLGFKKFLKIDYNCKGSPDQILRRPHEINEKNMVFAVGWITLAFFIYFLSTKIF